jgi:hypothetical protein
MRALLERLEALAESDEPEGQAEQEKGEPEVGEVHDRLLRQAS